VRAGAAERKRLSPSNNFEMSEISVTLPDGSSRRVPAGSTPADVAGGSLRASRRRRSPPSWTTASSICRTRLEADARVRIVTSDSPEALALYRHSTAHLMAAAVTHLFPGAQCGIGPATDEGFFYDFVVDRPFVPEDLEAIEKKMKELASAGPAVRAADVAARRGEAVLRRPRASRSRCS
jgi:threonyl-tRNA synthetase